MRLFLVLSILMVFMAGIFHMFFIMYDYAFYDSDSGFIPKLSEKLNETMTPWFQNKSQNRTDFLRDAFGISRVICIGLAPVCFILELATSRKRAGDY